MKIYAMSDLHLSLNTNKEMDVFGDRWEGYHEKIEENWNKTITDNDVVLVPGDISWATYLKNAIKDFTLLNSLPGTKIILKGNHDYWWTSLKKINKFLKENEFNTIDIIHNNCFILDNYVICGSRGWKNPEDNGFEKEDEVIYNRELIRLRLSLEAAKKKKRDIICALHFPPFSTKGNQTAFIDVMKEFNVKKCVYGHVHQKDATNTIEGIIDGIEFHFISADHLEFKPKLIVEL